MYLSIESEGSSKYIGSKNKKTRIVFPVEIYWNLKKYKLQHQGLSSPALPRYLIVTTPFLLLLDIISFHFFTLITFDDDAHKHAHTLRVQGHSRRKCMFSSLHALNKKPQNIMHKTILNLCWTSLEIYLHNLNNINRRTMCQRKLNSNLFTTGTEVEWQVCWPSLVPNYNWTCAHLPPLNTNVIGSNRSNPKTLHLPWV